MLNPSAPFDELDTRRFNLRWPYARFRPYDQADSPLVEDARNLLSNLAASRGTVSEKAGSQLLTKGAIRVRMSHVGGLLFRFWRDGSFCHPELGRRWYRGRLGARSRTARAPAKSELRRSGGD